MDNIIYGIWAAVAAFFAPLMPVFCCMVVFVIADFISGCMVSRGRGEKWQSKRFRESVAKLGSYLFVFVMAGLWDKIIAPEMLAKIGVNIEILIFVVAFMCGIEFYSILENCYERTGNRLFYILTQFTSKRLKDATGIGIDKNDNQ